MSRKTVEFRRKVRQGNGDVYRLIPDSIVKATGSENVVITRPMNAIKRVKYVAMGA